ncbi:MAG: hypothetical protein PHT33_14215 [bacterium]|nr:hypothetical protein [bacterium]
MIISRGRELRADWIAAMNYGSENFGNALKKVVQHSDHFSEYLEGLDEENRVNEAAFSTEYKKHLALEDEEKLWKSFCQLIKDWAEACAAEADNDEEQKITQVSC